MTWRKFQPKLQKQPFVGFTHVVQNKTKKAVKSEDFNYSRPMFLKVHFVPKLKQFTVSFCRKLLVQITKIFPINFPCFKKFESAAKSFLFWKKCEKKVVNLFKTSCSRIWPKKLATKVGIQNTDVGRRKEANIFLSLFQQFRNTPTRHSNNETSIKIRSEKRIFLI